MFIVIAMGVTESFIQNYNNVIRWDLSWDDLAASWSRLARINRRQVIERIGRFNFDPRFIEALHRAGYTLS